jgi:Zn-dependent metalloprotease
MKKFNKGHFFFTGIRSICMLLGLMVLQGTTYAQDQIKTLQDLAPEATDAEFFVIRKDLNLSKETYLQKYLFTMGLAPQSSMRWVSSDTDHSVKEMIHHKYQQYVNDVKVEGGEMILHEQYGRIKYVNGQYMLNLQPLSTNVQPGINPEMALQAALKQIQSTDYLWLNPEAEAALREIKKDQNATYLPKAELMFVANKELNPEKRRYTLCWQYKINVNPVVESYAVYIDAQTGAFFNKIPLVLECSSGSSTTLWNGARTINTQLFSGSYRTIDDCISAQIHTKNGNGANTGVGSTYYTDADNSWPSTALGMYIAQTHWSMRETRNYFFNIHGRNGIDNLGHDYTSYLNPGFSNNAYYSSSTETFSFGGTSTGANPVIELDVAAHEATHGVINFTSNLAYQLESGALNESFADIFGETAEDNSLGSHDWIIANNIALGPLRDMTDPNNFSDPDTYTGTFWINQVGCVPSYGNDYCGVHRNSGVQNYWYFLLSDGGSGTNDLGNAFTVTGIGIDKAKLIAYQSMINLTTNSTFANARTVSIQAAKDLYGDCSNEAIQTTNAWHAVGVGAAYVAPAPILILVSVSNSFPCSNSPVTVTGIGASTYTWSSGLGSGNPKVITPSTTSTYTVTGTNAESCTGTRSFTLNVNALPTVVPTTTDNNICPEQSTTIQASTNGTKMTLETTLTGTNGLAGNVFNVQAYHNITITNLSMDINAGSTQAEVWYKAGGYGNANLTSSVGWTQLGTTVSITPPIGGGLTLIPTTADLTIPAGQVYGIAVVCNGSNVYSNGTSVGAIYSENTDLAIMEGHGGSGMGGSFNFTLSPRVFNGNIEYRSNYTSYSWAPTGTLSSATVANPIATPFSSTTYTLTATDGNGCSNTGTIRIYENNLPSPSATSSPSSVCLGSTVNLTAAGLNASKSEQLLTPIDDDNGFAGNVFDVTAAANKTITINTVSMVIISGTQAEVWYKPGGYGGINVTSSVGWTKLGSTVAITPAGSGALTTLPLSTSLTIPAGQTYGLMVVCDGSNRYTNGTGVGNLRAQSPDLSIFEGHGGSGFGGTFNFINSPRTFNGRINYTVETEILSYSWSPAANMIGSSTATPTVTPQVSTSFVVTATDANGCTGSDIERVYVTNQPQFTLGVTPNSACPGSAQQLSVSGNQAQTDAIFTSVKGTNGFGPNGGNVFDITTSKAITITGFKMHMETDATQAEVWYKSGGYGSANLTSNVGWTKLGATVSVSSAGNFALTNIPITTTLSIPAGATYGFAVVCDGSVNYSNGISVGTTAASNPDLVLKQGHGGTGFGGTFNFLNSPRVFDGQIDYTVTHTFTNYAWTPNSNISNATISNPTVTPPTSTAYSVTVTDNTGCTGTGSIGVEVMNTPLGSASASPSSLCVNSNVTLNYTAPAGNVCMGVVQSGFAGSFVPATWTTTLTNSNGTINTALAPASITMTSSNGAGSGSGITGYQHIMPCSGFVTFNWSYSTVDAGPQYDFPRYTINGGSPTTFAGFQAQNNRPKTQVGTFSVFLNAGETLQIQMYTSDNIGGAGTLNISNFKAPYQTSSAQTVQWYTAPTGGTLLGSLNPLTIQAQTAGPQTYYAQVTAVSTGCVAPTRAATNIVVVDQPSTTASASTSIICEGTSTTLTASGAVSYTWQPGALSGASVIVSPTTTTTYTVTGTSALGCTKTATVTITVNPLPVITGSANPGIVCPGSPVTLTGTTAGVTWNWQPGNLNGSPVVVNPVAQTTYTVTATSAAGCTKTQTFVILMHPTPTASTTVSPSATICSGQTATITATGGVSYLWQPGNTTGNTRVVSTSGTYTVTVTNTQGCTATATRVITVNALPSVGTTISNATICAGSSTTITGTGALTYVWQPGSLSGTSITVSPATTTTYTVTGTNANGCTNTSTRLVTVTNCGNSQLTVKVLHQGYYNGAGFMGSVLQNQGQPNGPSDCDTVIVRLHNASAPYAMAHSYTGVLQTNGNIVCSFPPSINGVSYYIGVRQRNAIETWSMNPVLMSAVTNYDFSNALNKAYGSNQISLGGGFFAIYNGDINQDGVIDGLDYNDWEVDNNNFAGGYYSSDLNGDGIVDGLDFLIWEDNNNNFIGSQTP